MPSARQMSARKSVLKNFVVMPRRAMADPMLPTRFQVLMAICIVVDNETGFSTITQRRISERTGLHRNTVGDAIKDLERRGYVRRISRGRQKTGIGRGRFKTFMYEVNFDRADFDPAQRKVWPDGAHSAL